MKYTLIIVAVVLIGIGVSAYLGFYNTKESYERVTETKEVEVKVDALEKQIADAIQASSTEIEVRAQNAYEATKRQAEVEVELAVRTAYREKLEVKEKELQKESIDY